MELWEEVLELGDVVVDVSIDEVDEVDCELEEEDDEVVWIVE